MRLRRSQHNTPDAGPEGLLPSQAPAASELEASDPSACTPGQPEGEPVSPRVHTEDPRDAAAVRRRQKQEETNERIAKLGLAGFRVIMSAEAGAVSYAGVPVEQLPKPGRP